MIDEDVSDSDEQDGSGLGRQGGITIVDETETEEIEYSNQSMKSTSLSSYISKPP